jgi:hypothetical protein
VANLLIGCTQYHDKVSPPPKDLVTNCYKIVSYKTILIDRKRKKKGQEAEEDLQVKQVKEDDVPGDLKYEDLYGPDKPFPEPYSAGSIFLKN